MNELIDDIKSPLVEPDVVNQQRLPKKADVAEHQEVFRHVGLRVNEPPTPGLNPTGRVALYLVSHPTTAKYDWFGARP